MARLYIYDRRERLLVGAADRLLRIAMCARRPRARRPPAIKPSRILLLRLERIGDLLMTLPAIADLRAAFPDARIDLVVGRWNQRLAEAFPHVNGVRLLDAQWLAREGGGLGLGALLAAARAWRTDRYDLAVNFEPDIRSNLLLSMAGARWAAGYASGGGGALLDVALDYDTTLHTTDNARRLVAAVAGRPAVGEASVPSLPIRGDAQRWAQQRIGDASGPLVGVHTSGGRAVKQWDVERFGEVARRLVEERGATIVLTGSAADRPLVDRVKAMLPPERAVDLAGDLDLPALAAVIAQLDLFVTGDTGPMHVATAVGTPIVAVFGPSDPARYAPRGPFDRVVRVDLPCSPCNRIRLPPERCTGHTPDCLALVGAGSVVTAAVSILDARTRGAATGVVP